MSLWLECPIFVNFMIIEQIIIEEQMSNEQADQGRATFNERCLSQNARILKLIKSKMQPLQKSQSSKLFLPKIRHFLSKSNSNDKEEKKYIEIEIKEEEDQIALNTEIEEEHKYDIETKRINYRLNSKKRTKNIIESLMKQSHAIPKKQESLSTSFRFNNVLLEQASQRLDRLSIREDQFLKEEQRNKQRLSKIKQGIDDSKRRFVNNVKLSEYLEERNDKQNLSFQYLVNRMQVSKDSERITKNMPISAYEAISPNKISDYLELLQPTAKPRGFTIEEETKEVTANEPKPRRHLIKKTTMVPHEPHAETEHVASKLRLKANHRRLIEINK